MPVLNKRTALKEISTATDLKIFNDEVIVLLLKNYQNNIHIIFKVGTNFISKRRC